MTSSIRVFDHFCKPLASIEAPTTPRSWILNGFGKCEFSLGLNYIYDKFYPREENILQYNNLLYIEHIPSADASGTLNGKLPAWVGIILPDRTWNTGILAKTVYSAEAILTFRPMPLVKVTGTPKDIFTQILDHAAKVTNDIVIQPGVVEDLPQTFSDNLVTTAYEHIVKLCNNAGMDWDVTADVDARGNLQLYANLYQRKGVTTALQLTEANTEQASPLLTEQRTIYNVVYGYSQASTAKDRFFAMGRNEESIGKYGVLATNMTFSGITDQTALQNTVQTAADTLSQPSRRIHCTALDSGSTFDFLRVGNVVTRSVTGAGFRPGGGFGFQTQARILSMDYNDLTNNAPLNIEVV